MTLCKVLGTVTATAKHPAFNGRRLMVVEPIDEKKRSIGASFIAIDRICSAGPGDSVLVMREGKSAARAQAAKALAGKSGGFGGESDGALTLQHVHNRSWVEAASAA